MSIKYVPALAYPTPFERIFLMHDGFFIPNNIGFTYVLTIYKQSCVDVFKLSAKGDNQ